MSGELVKLIKSKSNMRVSEFMLKHNLLMDKNADMFYSVYQVCQGFYKDGSRKFIGVVFRVPVTGCVWCFEPLSIGGSSKPETCFYADTRHAAISSYLESTGKELTDGAVIRICRSGGDKFKQLRGNIIQCDTELDYFSLLNHMEDCYAEDQITEEDCRILVNCLDHYATFKGWETASLENFRNRMSGGAE